MPEIKNNFIQGKMNKDLDDRLLPNGQYRDAQNITITKSDDSDVGVLQNVKGNKLPYGESVNVPSGTGVIGVYVDNEKEKAYYFVTDRSTGVFEPRVNIGEGDNTLDTSGFHAIYVWDQTSPGTPPKKIVEGSFLNFSKDYLITGVSKVGDMLFFTDNLNQPRRINVETAARDSSFYDSEQKISVAKFAPFYPIRLLDSSNNSTMTKSAETSSDFLEKNFVRFSYRFKYDDGEYSTMAPFSQVAFIPSIYDGNTGFTASQLSDILDSFEVKDMINYINNIVMSIKLPSSTALEDLQISKIQILSRVDGDLTVKVIDDLDMSLTANQPTGDTISYTYNATEPFKTLPENQTIRVFDNVPIRAKAQETTGNRVVYGNFVNQRRLPNVDFDINFNSKASSNVNENEYLYKEYPYHSVKSRRKYQVGVVLADIFGRQTSVILPPPTSAKTSVERSSIFVPARNPRTFSSKYWTPYDQATDGTAAHQPYNTDKWGDALNITFNQKIKDAYSSSNPFGWYSYRIVVKQVEQEYYNVYTDGINIKDNNEGFVRLSNDNVNKVPRDVTDVDPSSDTAGSQVKLYSKVINTNVSTDNAVTTVNETTRPGILSDDSIFNITSIGNAVLDGTRASFAKIPANQTLIPDSSDKGKLAVFETEPFDSKIDIFFETSTAGLVSDLNTAIEATLGDGVSSFSTTELNNGLNEGMSVDTLFMQINARNNSGLVPSAEIELESVQNSAGDNVSDFELVIDNSEYKLKTKNTFFFGVSGEVYTFNLKSTFNVVDSSGNSTEQIFNDSIDISLKNVSPTISFDNNPMVVHNSTTSGTVVTTVNGTTGSVKPGFEKQGLTYSITSQTNNGAVYSISSSNGDLSTVGLVTSGQQDSLVIRVTDSDNTTFVEDTLVINSTGINYKTFYITTSKFSTSDAAKASSPSVLVYHEGSGDLPAGPSAATGPTGDVVYSAITPSLVVFNGIDDSLGRSGFWGMAKEPGASSTTNPVSAVNINENGETLLVVS